MRISTEQLTQNLLYGIQSSYGAYNQSILEVNTGKQVSEPSDNPAGTAQAIDLTDQLTDITGYNSTLQSASSFLNSSESALSSVNNLLLQARSIAVQAASGTLDQATRSGLAGQIGDIITSLGNIANSQYGTQYLFGGQQDSTAPFTSTANGYQYNGGTAAQGDGAITLQISSSQSLTINVTGDQIFSPLIGTGSAGPPPTQSILGQLQTDIAQGNISAISNPNGNSSDLAALDAQTSVITTSQADVGSKIDLINQETTNNQLASTNIQSYISNIVDANMPQAITNLQAAQTAYQTALDSTAQSLQISLLNFLQ